MENFSHKFELFLNSINIKFDRIIEESLCLENLLNLEIIILSLEYAKDLFTTDYERFIINQKILEISDIPHFREFQELTHDEIMILCAICCGEHFICYFTDAVQTDCEIVSTASWDNSYIVP